uniref:Uncharacterized protein n=1 Tax=Medicago truncatula TaxID=3880 RepID=A2Q5D4_MEDTR|nr:hypothetical protein MtrDRAFT_AC160924g13v1 [Medicago truncatula]
MYAKRAFVHWYACEGMEECDLGKKIIAKLYFLSANNFTFPPDNFTNPADNFTFPADPKILWYYLTWEPKSWAKSAGNVFPAEFTQKSAAKSEAKFKVLVMAELATKKVGAEPGLVSRLAGGWLRPCLHIIMHCPIN